ncbi:MAG: DUF177 domain-containing protein [Thermoplasmata archaeon]|nr:DUF177 domain-containing protein [Thermoplasmata archaeon]
MPSRAPTPVPEFPVALHDLDAGGKDFHFPVRVAWLRGVLEGTDAQASDAGGVVALRASLSGTDVIVRGFVTAELTVPCARCLEPARVRVHEELTALAVPRASVRGSSSKKRGADVEEPDEADVLPYDGEVVVLDDLVRDGLLLGIPMIPLCSEGCPGIRPGS